MLVQTNRPGSSLRTFKSAFVHFPFFGIDTLFDQRESLATRCRPFLGNWRRCFEQRFQLLQVVLMPSSPIRSDEPAFLELALEREPSPRVWLHVLFLSSERMKVRRRNIPNAPNDSLGVSEFA